jgi:hypothetical protein
MCFANLIKNGGCGNGTFIPVSFLSPIRGNLKNITAEQIFLSSQQMHFSSRYIPSSA